MYKVGDVVQLKSGGPKMTIQRIIGDFSDNDRVKMADNFIKISGYKDGDVICEWFAGTKVEAKTFNNEMIELCEK